MAALGRIADAGEATFAAIWIESRSPRNECLLSPGADVQDAEISSERAAANGQKETLGSGPRLRVYRNRRVTGWVNELS